MSRRELEDIFFAAISSAIFHDPLLLISGDPVLFDSKLGSNRSASSNFARHFATIFSMDDPCDVVLVQQILPETARDFLQVRDAFHHVFNTLPSAKSTIQLVADTHLSAAAQRSGRSHRRDHPHNFLLVSPCRDTLHNKPRDLHH